MLIQGPPKKHQSQKYKNRKNVTTYYLAYYTDILLNIWIEKKFFSDFVAILKKLEKKRSEKFLILQIKFVKPIPWIAYTNFGYSKCSRSASSLYFGKITLKIARNYLYRNFPERFFASFFKMATKSEKNIFSIQFYYRMSVIGQIISGYIFTAIAFLYFEKLKFLWWMFFFGGPCIFAPTIQNPYICL